MRSYPRAATVALILLLALPNLALAQASMPSAAQIEGQLSAPRAPIPPNARVTLPELTRRPDLRAQVPSIDIQSINFEFGSAAVGTRAFNQALSERRAESIRAVLSASFGVPSQALVAVGYGEDFLLVPVPYAEWRNRRVTIRRITDAVVPY